MTLRRKFERFKAERELEKIEERKAFKVQIGKEILKKHERMKEQAKERGIARAKRSAIPTSVKLSKGIKQAGKQLQGFSAEVSNKGFPIVDVPDMGFGTTIPKRERRKPKPRRRARKRSKRRARPRNDFGGFDFRI